MEASDFARGTGLRGERDLKVFVTVGSMLPFDRLIRAVESWAQAHPKDHVVAQVGDTVLVPEGIQAFKMLSPDDYRRQCAAADVIVSHVGMGTIITAAELSKPVVIMARKRELGEVTSDHQIATARWLRGRPGVWLIDDEADLSEAIASAGRGAGLQDFGAESRARLIARIRSFVLDALAG